MFYIIYYIILNLSDLNYNISICLSYCKATLFLPRFVSIFLLLTFMFLFLYVHILQVWRLIWQTWNEQYFKFPHFFFNYNTWVKFVCGGVFSCSQIIKLNGNIKQNELSKIKPFRNRSLSLCLNIEGKEYQWLWIAKICDKIFNYPDSHIK